MTRAVARAVLWLSVTAVVLVAGGHTVYYLFNWEWNRASIAGIGFVAGLVIAATFLMLGRLQRLERRLDLLLATHEAGRVQTSRLTAYEPSVEPRPDFPWLSRPPVLLAGLLVAVPGPETDQAVFIPVFLAAGLVLSVVAGAVERVAAFVQGRSSPPPAAQELLQERSGRVLLVLPLTGLVVVALAVGGLYVASHYWSRPIGPGVTTLSVQVDNRGPTTDAGVVVETAGRFCAVDTGVGISFAGVAEGPAGTTLLRVEPLLDDDAQRRYIGCLEDALLEWHRLTVTGTALEAAGP